MRDDRLATGFRVLDAGCRQARHLDHHEVDVLRIGQARVAHRVLGRLGDLADLAHAADLLRRDRLRARPSHDQPLVAARPFVRDLDPFSSHGRDVRRDHAGAPA